MSEKEQAEKPVISGTSSVRIDPLKSLAGHSGSGHSGSGHKNRDGDVMFSESDRPGVMNCTNAILQLAVRQQESELLELRTRVSVQDFMLRIHEARCLATTDELKRTRSWLDEANRKIDQLTSSSDSSRRNMRFSQKSGILAGKTDSEELEWHQPNPLPRAMR